MGSYSGRVDRNERAGAIAGVALVHIGLAAVILTGLNVETVRKAVETITTVTIFPPDPPPPPPPQERELVRAPQPPKESGAVGKKATPSPIVAPETKLPPVNPIAAAPVAGAGRESSSGAGTAGTGTGAGGNGTGSGAGGAGFTPARRIAKIPDRAYRQLSATGRSSGSVGVTIKVETDGSVSNCRIRRSSGNPDADALMCQLTLQYVRFAPARDPQGRPVAQDVTFFPNWWKP